MRKFEHFSEYFADGVWRDLVAYSNFDFTRVCADHVVPIFRGLLLWCMKWMGPGSRNIMIDGDFEDLFWEVGAGDTLEDLAAEYQSSIRGVLEWLVTHKLEVGKTALKFLECHMRNIEFERCPADFDPECPYFIEETLVRFPSIVSPICYFVTGCIREYEDSYDLDLTKVIPIGICERVACGNFMIIERSQRKKYCSNRCRALANRRTPEIARSYRKKHENDLVEMNRKPIRFPKKHLPA